MLLFLRFSTVYFLVLGFLNFAAASEDSTIVLKNGEVWVKKDKSKETQITNTGSKIDKIEISPSKEFASANKIIDYYEQENDIENPTSYTKEPIYSVLIIDLNIRKVIIELKAPRETTHPLGWQPNGTYQFGEGSPLDIHTVYEYNPKTGYTKKIDN